MKNILSLLVFASFFATGALAQPLNRSTPEANKKSAEEAEATDNPYEALELYEKAYDDTKDPAIAIKIAMLHYTLRDYDKAEKALSRMVLRDRKGELTELKYHLAMSMKFNGKCGDAVEVFNQYIAGGKDAALVEASKREVAGCEAGRKMKQPENLMIANIGKKANSPQTEASPSYGGGELYYISLQAKDIITLDGKEGDWYAKVYSSSKTGAEFGPPAPLGTHINREGWHQGNVSVTADGKTMYFTRVQMQNNVVKESKIFYAPKGADGWGAANEISGVNGEYIVKHPCEGELFGEKVLFFVANMPGGKGGCDLYYAPKKGEGQFGGPVNLGAVINTVGEEASPFYRDGKLYFSSNGRPTLGGLDVFESQWNGSVWSEPKILPAGVNSSVDDLYYSQSADGYTGFFVSNRPGPNSLKSKTCCDDIYSWELERIKVDLLAKTFRLKRKGEKENQPLTACLVSVYDASDKTRKPTTVDEKNNAAGNDFTFSLVPDKTYLIVATHEGYQPDTVRFNTVGIKKTSSVEKKLTLRLVRKAATPNEPDSIVVSINEPIRMDNIYYDLDKADIRKDAEPDLQFLTGLLQQYPDMKIELSSHTDARGRDEYNQNLSQRRAESARAWIIAKGIKADRIVPKGYGETQLLNGCGNGVECGEEEHQLNRRTEFKIIAGPTEITIQKVEKRPKPAENKPKGGG
jgi:peptidoglycan-associated lipoprotein